MGMKIVIVLLFIICTCKNVVSSTNASDISRNIEIALEEKCDRNTQIKNAANNFRGAFSSFSLCFDTPFYEELPHPLKQYDNFCRYIENNTLYECVENAINNIAPCLDPLESYLPPLMLNTYNSSLETLCGPNGLSNTEYLFNKIRNKICISNVKNTLLEGTCLTDKLQFKNLRNGIIDFNKEDLCLDLKSFLDCTIEVFDEICSDDYSIFMRLILKPLLQECNGVPKHN